MRQPPFCLLISLLGHPERSRRSALDYTMQHNHPRSSTPLRLTARLF
jgi:hypothetical protein